MIQHPKRILLISEQSDLPELTETAIRQAQWEIVFENKTKPAYRRLSREYFDLILLADRINDESSQAFIHKIRSSHRLIPVIILFSELSTDELILYAEAGNVHFIRLPASPSKFESVIKKSLIDPYLPVDEPDQSRALNPIRENLGISAEVSFYANNDEEEVYRISGLLNEMFTRFYTNAAETGKRFKTLIYEAMSEISGQFLPGSGRLFIKIYFHAAQIEASVCGEKSLHRIMGRDHFISGNGPQSAEYNLDWIKELADETVMYRKQNQISFLVIIPPHTIPAAAETSTEGIS